VETVTTNGTDEGVLRDWLDREQDHWFRASESALRGMIEHLQHACFVESWDKLRAGGNTETEAGRITLEFYEDGIGRIFSFLRASGALPDEVAWSELKAGQIDAAQRADVPQPLLDALSNGFASAERRPRGDHALYRDWSRCLMLYFYQHAAGGPRHPGFDAPHEDKLAWAAEVIEDVRDRGALLAAMVEYLGDADIHAVASAIVQTPIAEVLEHQSRLTDLRRFDLILHTGLLWLIGAVERE
jgi:hypothetical protein